MTWTTGVRTTAAETRAGLPILSFGTTAALDSWLSAEPRTGKGVWLRLAKKGSVIAGISRAEAIDTALCHGWIDGQQDRYDADSWLVRFTPRRRASRWSQINRARALELIEAGRMNPAGLAEIDAARSDGRWDAAYAPARTAAVPPDLQSAFDASPDAAAFFATLKGANRYALFYRLGAITTPTARARRVGQFVAMLERGEATRV